MQSKNAVTTKDLAQELAKDCRTLEDIQELLKNVFKDTIQSILEYEIEDHLGYEKNSVEGNNSGNSRNGYYKKTIKTTYGPAELDVPRDRNGEFEPQVIKKHQKMLMGSKNKLSPCMPKACLLVILKTICGIFMALRYHPGWLVRSQIKSYPRLLNGNPVP